MILEVNEMFCSTDAVMGLVSMMREMTWFESVGRKSWREINGRLCYKVVHSGGGTREK